MIFLGSEARARISLFVLVRILMHGVEFYRKAGKNYSSVRPAFSGTKNANITLQSSERRGPVSAPALCRSDMITGIHTQHGYNAAANIGNRRKLVALVLHSRLDLSFRHATAIPSLLRINVRAIVIRDRKASVELFRNPWKRHWIRYCLRRASWKFVAILISINCYIIMMYIACISHTDQSGRLPGACSRTGYVVSMASCNPDFQSL